MIVRQGLIVIMLAGLLFLGVSSVSSEHKGLAIAEEADRRDRGWGDSRADAIMVLRNRQGQESTRKMRLRWLEVDADGDKVLVVFDRPKDVKGTALLSHTHSITPDDQWLYLPALKRVKRIAAANKSGPFVGSEFAYEDMVSHEVPKYTYKWLRDEALDGVETLVVERYPAYEHSGYTRQIVWIRGDIYRPARIEFYDRKNELLKTLIVRDYRRYLDRYWRPDHMEMINHQTGKSTRLTWSNYRFKTGLSERDFHRRVLKSVR